METDDMLRLLAGFCEAEDYETPATRLTDALAEPEPARRAVNPDDRAIEVALFVAAAGGEI